MLPRMLHISLPSSNEWMQQNMCSLSNAYFKLSTIIRMTTEYPHFHPKFNASKKHAWRRRAKERCRDEVKCCLFNMQIEPIQFNRDESIYIWSFAHVSFSSYYRNLYNNTYYKYTRMSAVCIVQVYCISFVVCFPCKYAVCLVLLTF